MQKCIMEKVDLYDYTENVNLKVTELKNSFKNKKTNSSINLKVSLDLDNRYRNEESLISSIANAIIEYRTIEKAYVILMKEGVIYPVSICNGKHSFYDSFYIADEKKYTYNFGLEFKRLIFDEFIIL